MLTVYSVLWGEKYSRDYAYLLQAMVKRNLSLPHRFVCVTDHDLPGIETIRPICDWEGWWQKLQLWEIADGPSLYFDLDVVITGSLDYLEDFTRHKIAAPANWAQSGHGGIQSSVLAWNGEWKAPYRLLDYEKHKDNRHVWGDQGWLTELCGDDFVKLPGIYSYKYHCRHGLPDDCAVSVFHGKPDPHEVTDEWVSRFRSM